MSLTLLTIQTASNAASIALTVDQQLIGELVLGGGRAPSNWLLDATHDLLSKTDRTIDDLDGFAVVVGPGAFTGLRVGLSTVKGLAMAVGKPVVGVSTLETLAMQAQYSALPVCAMLDARKKEVYACVYTMEKGVPSARIDETVISPEKLLSQCQEPTLFVGDGATAYRTLIVRQLGDRAHFLPAVCDPPRASLAACLAVRFWQAGLAVAPEELLPKYIRASEAEINWEKAGKKA